MPNLTSAAALELRKVRVTFDGALSDLTSGTNGALNKANWSFQGQATSLEPVASVSAKTVEQVSTSVLDITADAEFTPEMTYQVTAKAAADGGITGVPASPDNKATFVALLPVAPAERDFDVFKMIPRMNISEDDSGDLRRFLGVLRDPLRLLLNSVDRWTDIIDYAVAPENFLDLQLQDLGFSLDIALTEIDKRRLLSVFATMLKQRGTAKGIRSAIRFFLGYESDVLYYDQIRAGGWTLDVSKLDESSQLGESSLLVDLHGSDITAVFGSEWARYGLYVKIGTPNGVALTADEDKKARAVIEFMKSAPTRLLGLAAALPPPGSVAAVGASGQNDITWGSVTGASGYAVFWSPNSIVNALSPTGAVDPDNASPYAHTGLSAGDQRWYIVCARDGTGKNGVGSLIVSATAT